MELLMIRRPKCCFKGVTGFKNAADIPRWQMDSLIEHGWIISPIVQITKGETET